MRAVLKNAVAMACLLVAVPVMSQDGDRPATSASVAEPTPAPRQSPTPVAATATMPSRGELVAIAGDCAGCHADPAGASDFSGGLAMTTPMGTMYARNITSDPETGIGGWTLEEFDRAVRQGKSKTLGRLYPAMPYTSYRYMTDEDVRALYDYVMKEVPAVNHRVPDTKLGFPFLRVSMLFWDGLFSGSGKAPQLANPSEQVQRGQYLVDVLGHCGECHTPRGLLFQPKAASRHLGGADVGGWYAPNISSDKTGIGDWSDEQLKHFLAYGKGKRANAGGDMGLAVRMSLSKLPASDLDAMVAYLKATGPVAGQPLAPIVQSVAALSPTDVEPVNANYKDYFDASSTNGALLYISACATCHGSDGSLAKGAGPSLTHSGAVRLANPANVVQTITNGINLVELDRTHLMPAFRPDLSNAQIAALATYVRQRFGGIGQAVSEAQVTSILAGTNGVPWLLLNARWLAWLGVLAAVVVIAGGLLAYSRRSRKTRAG